MEYVTKTKPDQTLRQHERTTAWKNKCYYVDIRKHVIRKM